MLGKQAKGMLTVTLLACVAAAMAGQAFAADQVQVTIKIYDPDGTSTLLEAKKKVDPGVNAFDTLRSIVNLEFTTFPKLGVFITALAGVKAPDGFFWELIVDGQPSQVGIGDIKITKKIEIIWKLKRIENKKP